MHLKYRPEIDGLRTVAVVAVIFYHAMFAVNGVPLFEGGFIGVDIFFVISGYLITSIILRELASESFRFVAFYERRARRILPTLFLVMAVTTCFAWKEMLPSSLMDYSGSLLSALGFGSNIWFWLEDSYTADISMLKPMLHTWSLSVEEQFYVLFPILLIFLWRFAKNYLFVFFIITFFLSLALADYGSRHFADANFYLLPTRVWELMAGALLARIEQSHGRVSLPIFNRIMPSVGMALIVGSIIVFDDSFYHPSYLTLTPIIGTVLIVWFAGKDEYITKLLSTKLFVSIGLISYSLYLWHMPVFAINRIKDIERGNADMLKYIAVSVLLAAFTYWVVEKPFRKAKVISRRMLVIILSVTATALIAVNIYIIATNGAPNRWVAVTSILNNLDGNKLFKNNGKLCMMLEVNEACSVVSGEDSTNVVLVGDSHASALGSSLHAYAKENNNNFYSLAGISCLGIEGVKTQMPNKQGKFEDYKLCDKRSKDTNDFIVQLEPSFIVFNSRLPLYLNTYRFDNQEGGVEQGERARITSINGGAGGVGETIVGKFNEWLNLGHTLVLVYPVPEVGWHVPRLIQSKLKALPTADQDDPLKNIDISTSYTVFKKRSRDAWALLDSVGEHANLIRIYPDQLLCSEQKQRCYVHNDELVYYYDDDHLSVHGAQLIVNEIAKNIHKK